MQKSKRAKMMITATPPTTEPTMMPVLLELL
jgi:hypothetical protein